MTVALPSLKIPVNLNRSFVSAYITFVGFESLPNHSRWEQHFLEMEDVRAGLARRGTFFLSPLASKSLGAVLTQTSVTRSLSDSIFELADCKRLLQEAVRVQFRERLPELLGGLFEGRDEEDLRLIVAFHDFTIQLESVHPRHSNIKNHHLIRAGFEVLECFLRVIEGVYLYSLKLQTLLDDVSDVGLVVNN